VESGETSLKLNINIWVESCHQTHDPLST